MWKLSASHGKHLKPCTPYPNPHKPNICRLPTWEEDSLLSSSPLFFLPCFLFTSSVATVMGCMRWVVSFTDLSTALGFWRWFEQWTGFTRNREGFGGGLRTDGVIGFNGALTEIDGKIIVSLVKTLEKKNSKKSDETLCQRNCPDWWGKRKNKEENGGSRVPQRRRKGKNNIIKERKVYLEECRAEEGILHRAVGFLEWVVVVFLQIWRAQPAPNPNTHGSYSLRSQNSYVLVQIPSSSSPSFRLKCPSHTCAYTSFARSHVISYQPRLLFFRFCSFIGRKRKGSFD